MEDPFADRQQLMTIADYQFGAGAGQALFAEAVVDVTRTKSGRPNQIIGDDGRLVTLGTDGRFRLGIAGGRRLFSALSFPAYRVVVGAESEPFVKAGKNAFAKFVVEVDPEIRAGDEVLVVRLIWPDPDNLSEMCEQPLQIRSDPDEQSERLLAVGRAELDATSMEDFETGMAVSVRDGAMPASG